MAESVTLASDIIGEEEMRTESINRAMLVVLSAVFEALPDKARRRASVLIEDCADLVDDADALRLLDTFQANNLIR